MMRRGMRNRSPFFCVNAGEMDSPNRLARLQERLTDSGWDGLLVTHLPNIFYLTGFTGSSAAFLVTPRSSVFFTDGRYTEQASRQVKNSKIVSSRLGWMVDAAAVLLRRKLRRVGIEAAHLTVDQFRRLRRPLRRQAKLIPCVDWVEELRSIKSPQEIEAIRRSSDVVTKAFEEVLQMVRPGVRESELSAELEYRMKRRGAQKVSFDLIVASGPRSALPHGVASEKRVRRNEFLVFDLGAILRGYSSDFTRTVYVGRPSAKAREIYSIVRESQESAMAGIRAGVPAAEIDRLARTFIRRRGYGKFFVHSTGHGIGIEVHEMPLLSARTKTILQPGHVITVEPGIYLPGYGGVRIEDIVVVGKQGCENLTSSGKEFMAI